MVSENKEFFVFYSMFRAGYLWGIGGTKDEEPIDYNFIDNCFSFSADEALSFQERYCPCLETAKKAFDSEKQSLDKYHELILLKCTFQDETLKRWLNLEVIEKHEGKNFLPCSINNPNRKIQA